jgi:hypothetical protein
MRMVYLMRRKAAGPAIPAGHLDWGGAVASGEVVPAGKPGHVGCIVEDGCGDDGADAEDAREGRPARPDRYG